MICLWMFRQENDAKCYTARQRKDENAGNDYRRNPSPIDHWGWRC